MKTVQLENRFGVVGVSGIMIGVGELVGASLCIFVANGENPPRGFLLIFGLISHSLAYYIW